MNRNDEFNDFMKELDAGVPEIGDSIKKGSRRKARKQFLYQPLMGMAAVFLMFVLSVNLCAPVAKAFSNVPLLKELTKAVAFSKSLKAALENDYVQDVYLTQTKDGVTIEITSMIVDKQELTVFYRLISEQYDGLAAYWIVDGDNGIPYNTLPENKEQLKEEMRYETFIFDKDGMPEKMRLAMVVWNVGTYLEDVQRGLVSESNEMVGLEDAYQITDFEIELELDLAQIPDVMTYKINQDIELDGQKYTVTNIEIYPTYMNMNMVADEKNTATLVYLHFYVENENGEIFGDNRGRGERNGKFVACAESPYFYDGDIEKVVITGAEWMEKGKEKTYVNLTTGEVRNLPENIEMKEIRLDEGNYDLMFEVQYLRKMDFKTGDPFGLKFWFIPSEFYYDAEEKQYSGEVKWNVETDEKQCLVGESGEYEIRITDYPYEEVWLMNYYSHVWNADKEVSVTIK